MKKYLITFILFISMFFILNTAYAANGYTIDKYDVDIKINEDNSLYITENIVANFTGLNKHGIIRNIPVSNTIKRLDGIEYKKRVKVTDIKVNESHSISAGIDEISIKIGDEDDTVYGNKNYVISYKYDIGKDMSKDIDEFYFNIIGDQWDTEVSNVTFKITFPKEFDTSKIGFSSGVYGSVNNENIEYNVDGNVVTGSYNGTLLPYNGLTIRTELEEGYFIVKEKPIDVVTIFCIIFFIGSIILAYYLWRKYGKDDNVVETVEFYPPDNLNSLELAYIYKGDADSKDVISLLIYLANKGYLKIEEIKKEKLLGKDTYKIIKLKEYDGTNEYEREFFNGLFLSKKEVKESDLVDRFYKKINNILYKIKKLKYKIFEKKSLNARIILAITTFFVMCAFVLKPVYDFIGGFYIDLTGGLLFMTMGYIFILADIFTNKSKIYKSPLFIFGILFILFPIIIFYAQIFINSLTSIIIALTGIISFVILIVFLCLMSKRTAYGIEMLGKIKGFKNFLETAEKEKLEALVLDDPKYFYNILPYTYVLDISDKWIKKFETIGINEPDWYVSNTPFNYIVMSNFMHNTLNRVQRDMISTPNSSGGSYGSGGGFSGGGFGGGGGSSW